MNPYEALKSIIQTSVDVKIRPDVSFTEDSFPIVIISLHSSENIDSLNGILGQSYRFRCSVYSRTREESENLARQIQELDGTTITDDKNQWIAFIESRTNSFTAIEESGESLYESIIDLVLYQV